MTRILQPKLVIENIEMRSSWRAYLIPLPASPIERSQREVPAAFLSEVVRLLIEEWNLTQQVLLHSWKLHTGDCSQKIQENLKSWNPMPGTGVWPDRTPPGRWTEETFMNASAAMLKKEEAPLSSYQLLHIDGDKPARGHAADTLFGNEIVTQIFSKDAFSELAAKGRSAFLPNITDRDFKHSRFYLPLLEKKTILSAVDEQLSSWLCGAEVYIRESAEDKGVLLVSSRELATFFERAELSRTTSTSREIYL
jgi:hypothetical protein